MEEKTHRLTERELQSIVQSAVSEVLNQRMSVLTAKNFFDDVRFDTREIELINGKFDVANVLDGHKKKDILTNISFPHGWGTFYTKAYSTDIHNNIRKLTVNVFGKTLNSDLTRDEYEMARRLYAELRDWFLESYEKRLIELQKEKDSLPPGSN
ncbi:hypothetical protein [Enterococcus malodoratus]|uniref:hypothetical protein n=1 Tax=Enterococcus malodoratus TaxID=71451 RepID=UPI0039AF7119